MVPIDSILGPAFLVGLGLLALWARGREESVTLPPDGSEQPTVQSRMLQGRKIEAIKLYRRLHGVGLRDAKEAVEALAQGLPR